MGEPGAHMVIGREQLSLFAEGLRHDIEHAAADVLRHFLRQDRRAQPLLGDDHAAVRFYLARDDAHDRGFSGPVPADEADPFPRLDLEVDPFEQKRPAESDTDILKTDKRHDISCQCPLIIIVLRKEACIVHGGSGFRKEGNREKAGGGQMIAAKRHKISKVFMIPFCASCASLRLIALFLICIRSAQQQLFVESRIQLLHAGGAQAMTELGL